MAEQDRPHMDLSDLPDPSKTGEPGISAALSGLDSAIHDNPAAYERAAAALLDPRVQAAAEHILTVLKLAGDGRYVRFDVETEDRIDQDPDELNRSLLDERARATRKSQMSTGLRRRLALNRVRMYARIVINEYVGGEDETEASA